MQRFVFTQVYPPATAPAPNATAVQELKLNINAITAPIILLSRDGYPCLFYGDYYGVGGENSPHQWIIDKLLEVRSLHAYGDQINHFEDPNIIAIQRTGRDEWTGCVAVLSNLDEEGEIQVEVGKERAGQVWQEVTGSGFEDVIIDEEGNGNFKVEAEKISVWIRKN